MKWEYRATPIDRHNFHDELARAGEQGWELVCITQLTGPKLLIFKRPRPDTEVQP